MTKQPLRLVRRGRFLSPSARLRYRVHRLVTGKVLGVEGGDVPVVVIAYAVRLATLPMAVIADWMAMPMLRFVDRSDNSWTVVEVRFDGWNAEFVHLAEAASEEQAENLLAEINDADQPDRAVNEPTLGEVLSAERGSRRRTVGPVEIVAE